MQLVSLKGAEEANLVATCIRGSVVSGCGSDIYCKSFLDMLAVETSYKFSTALL